MKPLLGAILAGGLSTRMGSDKASLRLADGRMMIEHVADPLRMVCADLVVVGGSPEHAQLLRCATIEDQRRHAGPLAGIEALLASQLAREYLVCPCDVPFITPAVLRMLLQHRESAATVLRVVGHQQFDPLPARIASSAAPIVKRLLDSGERSVWKLMEELRPAIVDIDEDQAAALRNLNTPTDLNTP